MALLAFELLLLFVNHQLASDLLRAMADADVIQAIGPEGSVQFKLATGSSQFAHLVN